MIKLREKVLYCLKKDEQSRNSDIRLTQMIWWTYHNDKLFTDEAGKVCVRITELFDLPREDNIKRVRAKIQNEEKLYLPTSQEIRKRRGIKEEEWRKFLGYNPEFREAY